jgi:hypothetical protein
MTQVEGLTTVSPPIYWVTHDSERIDHIVTDAQLLTLTAGGKDKSFEICLAAFGLAFGFLQNFWGVCCSLYQAQAPVIWDFIGSAVFLVAVTTAILAYLSHRKVSCDVDDLLTTIRSRTKAALTPRGDASSKPESA